MDALAAQAYVERDALLRQFFDIEGELLEVVSDPSHYMFQGVGGNIWNSSLGFAPSPLRAFSCHCPEIHPGLF